ncbi:Formate/nitrite transporter domain-containing protein [Neurospora intermedia]|uniref:Formate/nitrite transporter domain-containing protein n=1 Tax=Neurospora intermedia TaxID=5142 RepID=A0ABR3DTE3_NEUIN
MSRIQNQPNTVWIRNGNAYNPIETIEIVGRLGIFKANMFPAKVFCSAVSAGCIAAFASGATLVAINIPWMAENTPGLVKTLSSILFPCALVMIFMSGADLFTGSTMLTGVACLQGRIPWHKMLLHWFICFWGNFAGCLFVMAIIFGYGGLFTDPAQVKVIQNLVYNKQVVPEWHQIFIRAIGCNWLVCLAAYLGLAGRDLMSRAMGMWWPVFCFAILGLDHVVVNMFYIPFGIWHHTPGVTVGLYIWKGIIPSLLGNVIGGGGFCGMFYYFMYLHNQDPVPIDGIYFPADLAKLEEGGALPQYESDECVVTAQEQKKQ